MPDHDDPKSGTKSLADTLQRFIEAADAGAKEQRLTIVELRRVFRVLLLGAGLSVLLLAGLAYTIVRSHESQARQDAFAAKLEAIAAQLSTVQQTADSTQTTVDTLEDRPSIGLEIRDAPASASGGPAQPTSVAVVVIRAPSSRPSSTSAPKAPASVEIPIPLPSAPSSAKEPK